MSQLSSNTESHLNLLFELRQVNEELKKLFSSKDHGKLLQELGSLEKEFLHLIFQQNEKNQEQITVAVVGDFSSGKSSFINALLQSKLCPVNVTPTTSSITHFHYGETLYIEEELANGTRKERTYSEYTQRVQHGKNENTGSFVFHVFVPDPILHRINLIDTPGFNNPTSQQNDTIITKEAVKTADVLFVIMDIQKGNPSRPLLEQLEKIRGDSGEKPAFLLINQADKQKSKTARKNIKKRNQEKYKRLFLRTELISSLELLDPSEKEILVSLDKQIDRAKRAIFARRSFAMNMSASLQRINKKAYFTIDIDRVVKTLSVTSYVDLASREVLVDMVEEIVKKRRPLLEKQKKRNFLMFQELWKFVLEKTKKILQELSQDSPVIKNVEPQDFNEVFQRTLESIKNDGHQMFLSALRDRISFKKKKKSGFFFTTKIFKIKYRYTAEIFKNHVMQSFLWTNIGESLRQLDDFLYKTHTLRLSHSLEELKETADTLMNEIHSDLYLYFDDCDDYHSKFDSRYDREVFYESIDSKFENFSNRLVHELIKKTLQPLLNQARDKVIQKTAQSKNITKDKRIKLRLLLEKTNTLLTRSLDPNEIAKEVNVINEIKNRLIGTWKVDYSLVISKEMPEIELIRLQAVFADAAAQTILIIDPDGVTHATSIFDGEKEYETGHWSVSSVKDNIVTLLVTDEEGTEEENLVFNSNDKFTMKTIMDGKAFHMTCSRMKNFSSLQIDSFLIDKTNVIKKAKKRLIGLWKMNMPLNEIQEIHFLFDNEEEDQMVLIIHLYKTGEKKQKAEYWYVLSVDNNTVTLFLEDDEEKTRKQILIFNGNNEFRTKIKEHISDVTFSRIDPV